MYLNVENVQNLCRRLETDKIYDAHLLNQPRSLISRCVCRYRYTRLFSHLNGYEDYEFWLNLKIQPFYYSYKPLIGTETRVNAQAQAYEFMTTYTEMSEPVGRLEKVVGWYHSHPGYGCWLSGIDVATQMLNQQFQEPFLAIVVGIFKIVQKNITFFYR